MLKSILQPHYNFKFNRESLSQDNSEQVKTLFSQEMYSKAANYANSNPDKIKQLLSQDSSNFSPQQLKQVELFKAIQSGSYEDYLQTSIITQESANSYYSQTQEAMSPREMDLTKVAEKMGREYKGLSNDEKNEELVNLAAEFENKKQNGTASTTDIMRLEVAYRLLGVNSPAEFKQKFADKGSKTYEVTTSSSKPTENNSAKDEERFQRRNAKILGINSNATKGELPENLSGKGFVSNLEQQPIGAENTKTLFENIGSKNNQIDEKFYTQDNTYLNLKKEFDQVVTEYKSFNEQHSYSKEVPADLALRYKSAYEKYSTRNQAISVAKQVLSTFARNGNESPTQSEIREIIEVQPFSATHKDVKDIVSSYVYDNPYANKTFKNEIKQSWVQSRVEATLNNASEK
jgi:hypothetical protein